MKNILFILSFFAAALFTSCNSTETKTENPETSIEANPAETTETNARPAHGEPGHNHEADHGPVAAAYTCPMHPEVTSDKPGTCPKCGMDLVKADDAAVQE